MIREISITDIDVVNGLGKEVNSKFDIYKKGPLEKVLVYELNNVVVGFLLYMQMYEVVEIVDVVVDENYRRQGIAKSLIGKVLEPDDVQKSILEVRVSNVAAINLYKSLGYKVVREIKNYYDDGENAFSMEVVK